MSNGSVLELESRRRIYAYIERQPGRYLREMQRALDMPMGALEYHLAQLEAAQLVTVLKEEKKRYFPARMDRIDKHVLAVLRQDGLRRVVVMLLSERELTHEELLQRLACPPSTLSYYMRRLCDVGMVDRQKTGRRTSYSLREPESMLRVLVRYRPTFLDRLVDNFLAGFDSVHLPRLPDGDER